MEVFISLSPNALRLNYETLSESEPEPVAEVESHDIRLSKYESMRSDSQFTSADGHS